MHHWSLLRLLGWFVIVASLTGGLAFGQAAAPTAPAATPKLAFIDASHAIAHNKIMGVTSKVPDGGIG